MKIELRNPTRTVEIEGAMSVTKLLNKLDVNSASVLVICDGVLVPTDAFLEHDAVVEIRNVISGGAGVIYGATV
jgi:sulfur carrier protein ThiS